MSEKNKTKRVLFFCFSVCCKVGDIILKQMDTENKIIASFPQDNQDKHNKFP